MKQGFFDEHWLDNNNVIDMHGIALQIVLQEKTPMAENQSGRHPGIVSLLKYFEYRHLTQHLQTFSQPCGDLAEHMVSLLPDSAELTAGLRKLLEAKDCFVRAALDGPNVKEV